MSHVYQPVMLRTLIDSSGKASVSEVAHALLAVDQAQLDYYREITKRMSARRFAGGAWSITFVKSRWLIWSFHAPLQLTP